MSSGDYLNFHNTYGCGKSVRWEYEAYSLILKSGEDCGHINIDNLIVKIKKDLLDKKSIPVCKIKCPVCKSRFPKTSQKITEEYLKFHQRNSEK